MKCKTLSHVREISAVELNSVMIRVYQFRSYLGLKLGLLFLGYGHYIYIVCWFTSYASPLILFLHVFITYLFL